MLGKVRLLILCGITLLLVSCGQGPALTPTDTDSNPSVSPSGEQEQPIPLDIPSATSTLQFPSDLGISIDTIRSTEALSTALSKAVPIEGPLGPSITRAGDNLHNVSTRVEEILDILNMIGLESSVDKTRVHTQFEVPATLQSMLNMPARVDVVADFAHFESELTAAHEPCSGNSQELPVCIRLWIDDTRSIAAVFTELATTESNGAGQLVIDDTALGGGRYPMYYGLAYDHSQADDRTTEFFVHSFAADEIPGAPLYRHTKIHVRGSEDANAVKTVFDTLQVSPGHIDGITENQSVMRWSDAGGAINGSFAGDLRDTDITPICGSLATGDILDDNSCAAIPIDDTAYVPLAESYQFALPDALSFPVYPELLAPLDDRELEHDRDSQ